MKQTYIVIFESKNRMREVKSYLQTFNAYSPITQNSWAIRSEKSAPIIRDELKPLIEPQDKIFVIRSGVEAAWKNQPQANTDWLKKYL